MGLTVVRPDVNESDADFTVVPRRRDGRRRKGQRDGKVDPLRARRGQGRRRGRGRGDPRGARGEGGPFTSLFDFCRRVDTQQGATAACSRRWSSAGALRRLLGAERRHRARSCSPRSTRAHRARRRRRSATRERADVAVRRCSPRAAPAARPAPRPAPRRYPEVEEWTPKQLLAFEKEALGFYISGHPLDRYRGDLHALRQRGHVRWHCCLRPEGRERLCPRRTQGN